jgi:hypothetical protein
MERVSIRELKNEYVICRTLGHAWDEFHSIDPILMPYAFAYISLRCTRCQAERHDGIDKQFQVASRTYKYPPHYQSIPGEGTRPNLRAELLNRSLLLHRYTTNGKRRL